MTTPDPHGRATHPSGPGAKSRPRRLTLGRILILAAGTFATGTDAFIIAGLLPEISGSLGASLVTAGQMVTVFALTYAVGSPLLVTATANWSRRRVPPVPAPLRMTVRARVALLRRPDILSVLLVTVRANTAGLPSTPTWPRSSRV